MLIVARVDADLERMHVVLGVSCLPPAGGDEALSSPLAPRGWGLGSSEASAQCVMGRCALVAGAVRRNEGRLLSEADCERIPLAALRCVREVEAELGNAVSTRDLRLQLSDLGVTRPRIFWIEHADKVLVVPVEVVEQGLRLNLPVCNDGAAAALLLEPPAPQLSAPRATIP